MAKVVFKHGSRAQFDAASKNDNQLYFINDTGEIYKGETPLARGNHYEATREDAETDAAALTRALGSKIALQDDIAVIKTLIAEDKYSYTAFIYDGSAWKAMDGNYDAENVFFDQDLTFTQAIGYVTLTNGQATVPAKGKNVKEVLEYLFAKEEDPTVINPSVSITSSTAKSYEVGTSVTPQYSATFNAGSYEYGPETGIEATWSVTDGTNTLTTAVGSFPAITVADNTSYSITATATYGAGATPVSNLGNEKADLAIVAGTASATSSRITGYRNMFIGANASTDEITSDIVRALATKRAAGNATITLAASSVTDASRVIVAIPATAGKSVTKVLLTSSMNADITSQFVKQDNIEVEGANGATAVQYVLYVYQPAALDSTETYSITIG